LTFGDCTEIEVESFLGACLLQVVNEEERKVLSMEQAVEKVIG